MRLGRSTLLSLQENPIGLLGIVWLWLHAAGIRSLVQGGVEVDTMFLLKMLLVQVGAAPFEYTAIMTQLGVVFFPVMSPNALLLFIWFSANIA